MSGAEQAKELPPEMNEGYLDAELRALGLDPQEVVAGAFNKVCAALKEKSNQLREVMAERDKWKHRAQTAMNISDEQAQKLAATEAKIAELEQQKVNHADALRIVSEQKHAALMKLRAVSERLEEYERVDFEMTGDELHQKLRAIVEGK